ncbi:LLM class F420-dependent oxidoreductase [Saccharothrix violaceirubra]|uniref:Putative F420-dependent oxidoreductase n=1 Tax=Saccharothrix violaceirubra TaxID=413306 RepID=A0A7W7T4L4_9PSEU|nr:TIGR03620 family F420-dependent LLM class oxidoreductase [Saccharothrix violaceirubra]MBB4965220.1 putative F420-dependent oxidoreductase [Saccharothrix violaceirubra]
MPTLGRVGLWLAGLDFRPAAETTELAQEVDELGFSTLWLSEGLMRDPFVQSALLLGASERLVVGTGVTVIWGRHPMRTKVAARALTDVFPDRFVLGLGISHPLVVEGVLGLEYKRPLAALRDHLEEMDAIDPLKRVFGTADTEPRAPRVLAALGPKALALSRTHADGAITYLVPPEHTAQAREVLGPDRTLVVEQAVVVDPAHADRADEHVALYSGIGPYLANWARLGLTERNRVERLVAIGEEAVARRIDEHLAAGADQVCLQVLTPDSPLPDYRRLAPLSRPA